MKGNGNELTSKAASNITALNVASKSVVEVSFNEFPISNKALAYFFLAIIIWLLFFVTFANPANPTELTPLKNSWLLNSSGQSGEEERSSWPDGRVVMIET